jgi:hypothetical protein
MAQCDVAMASASGKSEAPDTLAAKEKPKELKTGQNHAEAARVSDSTR